MFMTKKTLLATVSAFALTWQICAPAPLWASGDYDYEERKESDIPSRTSTPVPQSLLIHQPLLMGEAASAAAAEPSVRRPRSPLGGSSLQSNPWSQEAIDLEMALRASLEDQQNHEGEPNGQIGNLPAEEAGYGGDALPLEDENEGEILIPPGQEGGQDLGGGGPPDFDEVILLEDENEGEILIPFGQGWGQHPVGDGLILPDFDGVIFDGEMHLNLDALTIEPIAYFSNTVVSEDPLRMNAALRSYFSQGEGHKKLAFFIANVLFPHQTSQSSAPQESAPQEDILQVSRLRGDSGSFSELIRSSLGLSQLMKLVSQNRELYGRLKQYTYETARGIKSDYVKQGRDVLSAERALTLMFYTALNKRLQQGLNALSNKFILEAYQFAQNFLSYEDLSLLGSPFNYSAERSSLSSFNHPWDKRHWKLRFKRLFNFNFDPSTLYLNGVLPLGIEPSYSVQREEDGELFSNFRVLIPITIFSLR